MIGPQGKPQSTIGIDVFTMTPELTVLSVWEIGPVWLSRKEQMYVLRTALDQLEEDERAGKPLA